MEKNAHTFWKALHGSIPLSNLLPASKHADRAIKTYIKELGIPMSQVKFIDSPTLHPFIWFREGVAVDLMPEMAMLNRLIPGSFPLDALQKEAIAQLNKKIDRCLIDDDWETLFAYADKRFIIPVFLTKYRRIPEKKVYDVFIEVWQRAEDGFEMFTEEVLRYIFRVRVHSQLWRRRIAKFRQTTKTEMSTGHILKVYHGEQNNEYNPGDQCSWTLKRDVAEFFAHRYGNKHGTIEERYINPSEALDYLTSRNEEEVLLWPEEWKPL